jgi:hypothetical protein
MLLTSGGCMNLATEDFFSLWRPPQPAEEPAPVRSPRAVVVQPPRLTNPHRASPAASAKRSVSAPDRTKPKCKT